MDQEIDGYSIHVFEKFYSVRRGLAGLVHDGFPKGMVAADQEFVAAMEAFQVFEGWDSCEFSVVAAVAAGAAEDQIPDAVEIELRMDGLQGIGIKMIHVAGEVRGAVDGDVAKAVEAIALPHRQKSSIIEPTAPCG